MSAQVKANVSLGQRRDRNGFQRRLDRKLPWLALLLSIAVTAVVYGPTLVFSYFFDDAYDLTRTEAETFRSLLGPLPGYVYYRPLPFVIWKAIYSLTGRYDPLILHLLPVAAHALAGWLLFLLLFRLTRSRWSLVAAVLFLLYPFSYQAVEIIVSVFHPLVTAEILAALVLWYDGRVQRSPILLGGSSVVAVLALWTHEFGVVVFFLLASIEALLWRQRRVTRPTWWLLAPLLAEVVFIAVWLTVDKPPYPEPVTLDDIVKNSQFWLQGVAYPVSRQALWLASHLDFPAVDVGVLVALAGLLAALAGYAVGRQLRIGLVALACAGLAFSPAVATLTYGYMQDAPRLLYVVAPASAAFWGLLPMLCFRSRLTTILWRLTTVGLAALAIIQSIAFINVRTEMLDQGTDLVNGVIRVGAEHEGGSVLLMNVPSWFAGKSQEYPLGHLGVPLLPDYIGLERTVYAGSGARTEVESAALAANTSGWRYNFQPHGGPIGHNEIDARLRGGTALAVVSLSQTGLAVREPGTIKTDQRALPERLADFEDGLRLVSARVVDQGDLMAVTTRWYATRPLGADYQLWIQLRNPRGQVLAEQKGYPLAGMSPPRLWQTGDLVEDRATIELPASAGADGVTVWLSLVTPTDGSLLPPSSSATATAPASSGWIKLDPTGP